MTSFFGTLLQKAMDSRNVDAKTVEARDWLRDRAMAIRNLDPNKALARSRVQDKRVAVRTGQMYLFQYDALHKDTLPYYDRFPLIFPFRKTNDGF